ncbi:MAG: hypothetical protein JWQ64_1074 [Subtercola sp.]|nr:hypothetical protein [Subtercola sp.]
MSAPKRKVSGAVGAIIGLVGMSAIAGVLVTAMVTPALAVTGLGANSTISVFENLPTYIKPDALSQTSSVYGKNSDGSTVLLASFSSRTAKPSAGTTSASTSKMPWSPPKTPVSMYTAVWMFSPPPAP